MSNWVYHLNLKDLWEKRDKNTISVQELGKQVANRIRKLSCFKKYERELEDITTKFEFSESEEEFDNILSDLYDWADTPLFTIRGQMQRKMCWIATLF